MGEAAVVERSTAEGITTIVLNAPANRNALSQRLLHELGAAITWADADEATRAIVLTHTGPAFCSGADLKRSPAPSGSQSHLDLAHIIGLIWASPKPFIARLNGAVRAGGVGLMAACDIVVVADSVTFAFSEVRIGVIPAVISIPVLARIPAIAAHEYFLTGETFDARRAHAIGLVNRAVPSTELDAETDRYTAMFRLGAPAAVAGAKRLVRSIDPAALSERFEQLSKLSRTFFESDEAREGMRAFAEKRPPSWVAG